MELAELLRGPVKRLSDGEFDDDLDDELDEEFYVMPDEKIDMIDTTLLAMYVPLFIRARPIQRATWTS